MKVEANRQKLLKTFLYFGYPYAFLTTALYLIGFWSTFDINILPYMGISETLLSAVYPLLLFLTPLLWGLLFGQLMLGHFYKVGEGRETTIGLFLNKHTRIIVLLYIGYICLTWLLGSDTKWLVTPFLIGAPLAVALHRYEIGADVIQNNTIRWCVLYLLAIMPFMGFGNGKYDSLKILNGTAYDYVENEIFVNKQYYRDQTYKYLGRAGDSLFFLTNDNKTRIIVTVKDLYGLKLRKKGPGDQVPAKPTPELKATQQGVPKDQPTTTIREK